MVLIDDSILFLDRLNDDVLEAQDFLLKRLDIVLLALAVTPARDYGQLMQMREQSWYNLLTSVPHDSSVVAYWQQACYRVWGHAAWLAGHLRHRQHDMELSRDIESNLL